MNFWRKLGTQTVFILLVSMYVQMTMLSLYLQYHLLKTSFYCSKEISDLRSFSAKMCLLDAMNLEKNKNLKGKLDILYLLF